MNLSKKIVRNVMVMGLAAVLASPAAVSFNGVEAAALPVKSAMVGKTAVQGATEKKTTTKKSTTGKDDDKKSSSGKSSSEQSAETIKKNKKTAKKYVGKKLTSLVKKIGKYKKLTKAKSCYYSGEYDGIAEYDGFKVYCHTKNKKTWYVDSVE